MIGAIPLNACMLSMMFPARICWTNFSKSRNASCSQTRFAIRKVRRSGSVTPSISFASCAFTFGRAKCFESPFQSETLAGFASSKIFPDITPCAMKVAFSRRVNSVGSRPSMKRENIVSSRGALGPRRSVKRSWMKRETVL